MMKERLQNLNPGPGTDEKKLKAVISFLEEFKNEVDNSKRGCIQLVINSLLTKYSYLQKERELITIKRSYWYSTIILSTEELGGITVGLLRRAFKKQPGFFREIIKRLLDKNILREANEQEKIDFINRNRNFLEGFQQYHLHKLKVYVLTEKGRKIAEILKKERGGNEW